VLPSLDAEPARPHEAGTPPIKTYGSADYRIVAQFWQAAQTPDGQMHFAGGQGVLSFDGERWRFFPVPMATRSLLTGEDGKMWVGGTNDFGYVEFHDHSIHAYHSLAEKLPPEAREFESVWQILRHGDSIVFVADEHLFVWDGQDLAVKRFPTPRRLTAAIIDGRLLVSQRGTGLVDALAADRRVVLDNEALRGDAFNFATERPGGQILAGTFKAGFFELTRQAGGAYSAEPIQFPLEARTFRSLRLRRGGIATATHGEGVRVFTAAGKPEATISQAEGLLSDTVFNVFEDRDGNLWACHESGISWIGLAEGWTRFSNAQGLRVGIAYTLARFDGQLFCGGLDGLFALSAAPSGSRTPAWNRVPGASAPVWDAEAFSEGLFIGCHTGLERYEDDQATDAFPHGNDIYHVPRLGAEPRPWILSTYGKLITGHWRNGAFRPAAETTMPGIATSMVNVDETSILMGSTTAGPVRAAAPAPSPKPRSASPAPAGRGLDDAGASWSYVARLGGFLVAITDQGIHFRTREGPDWRPARAAPRQIHCGPYGVNIDPHPGAIWLTMETAGGATRFGRLQIDEASGEPRFQALPCVGIDELAKVHCLMVEPDEGVVWFGGNGGVIRETLRLAPQRASKTPIVYPLEFGGRDDASGSQHIAPVRQLAIEYALPNFGTGARSYQTRLIPQDSEWSAPSSSAFKEYTNLAEGDYRFEVRALIDGVPAGQASAPAFTILPPWHRTPLAYAAYASLAAGLLYLLHHWRTNRLRSRNLKLEQAVRERTIDLERSNMQLAQANTAKDRFLAMVSHEIRNPMNGIIGLANLLLEDPGKRQNKRLGHLVSTAQQLKTLLDGLLDYAAIDNGQIRVQAHPFDPEEFLEQIENLQQPLANDKGLALMVDARFPAGARVIADQGKLRQILLNLTGNAIKYTREGQVTLSGWMEDTGAGPSTTLVFEVSDSGPGIPQKDQARIFQQFERGAQAFSASKGIGLGLAIAQRLATLMQGTVQLISSNDKGSCFRLAVPAALTEDSPVSQSPAEGRELNGLRILVIEDEPYNLLVVEGVLSNAGAAVTTANSARDARRHFADSPPDLVLTDLNLLDGNGIELIEEFRAQETARDIPGVVMSAYASEREQEAIRRIPAAGFVAKPFSPRELLDAIQGGNQTAAPQPANDNAGAWDALAYLADGDAEKRKELQAELLASALEITETIDRSAQQGAFGLVRDAIHDLTPLARMSGDPRLNQLVETAREAAAGNDHTRLDAAMNAMNAQLRRLDPNGRSSTS